MKLRTRIQIDPEQDIAEQLRSVGITPTQQRLQIAELLFSRQQHISADQILAMVNLRGARASKATVYNTLGLFARKGLLRELIIDPTKVFYDSNISPHHHFYNLDSGELTDISPQQMELVSLPEPPDGTRVDDVDIIIRTRHSTTNH